MAQNGTVIASLARTLLDGAAAAGLDRGELVRALQLDPAILADSEGRISYRSYVALWDEVSRRAPDRDFGLHLAESLLGAATFSVVGFAAMLSDTMQTAVERVIRFSRVLNETTETRLDVEGDVAVITDGNRDPADRWPRHKAESILAAYVVLGRAWTASDWSPREVRFQHAQPDDIREHMRIFRCRLRFGAPRNQVLKPLTQAEDFVEAVRRVVGTALPGGTPSLRQTARTLGLSERTLQRRLGERGVGYATVVDGVRRELALRHLEEPHVSVGELALLLGFSEPKAFRRAFRRWTGSSPRQYRSGAPR